MIVNVAGEDFDCGVVSLHCEEIGKVSTVGESDRIAKITFNDYDELNLFLKSLYAIRSKVEEDMLKKME